MKVKLKVWRQKNRNTAGEFRTYESPALNENMSFLEMLDVVNEELANKGEDPIAFDHDCREGICGTCSLVIGGKPHGPHKGVATCQTYMRSFRDGDTIVVEPFRAKAFPIIKDLVVDRKAFDRIQHAGGFISVRTGRPGRTRFLSRRKMPTSPWTPRSASVAAACVAACKNASAMLFVAAKVSHLGLLPQGQPERYKRVKAMVDQMDAEGFGSPQ